MQIGKLNGEKLGDNTSLWYMSGLRVLFKWWHGFGLLGRNRSLGIEWWCWLLFLLSYDCICICLFHYKMNWWFSFDQLPCCSSHFAVLVEPYASVHRRLRTSCQAVFKECTSCMYIYYWRWGESFLFSLVCNFVYNCWTLKGEKSDSHVQ